MHDLPIHDYDADIAAVAQMEVVPKILEIVCQTTGMGFAAIARVTKDRWVACSVRDQIAFGLEAGGELEVETTICHEIRQSGEAVIIGHVAQHAVYSSHQTPALYGFQSYISMPIVLGDGTFFGTLCAIDPKPAQIDTPAILSMFKFFAELIASNIDSIRRLATTEEALLDERATSELREQFIAVLGHDLRNPLASIVGGTRLLQNTPLNEKAAMIVGLMASSANRMAALIDNVLDFARGRLGGGITLNRRDESLGPLLEQTIAELQTGAPDRKIETTFDLAVPVDCDRGRMGQVFSNLLSNALTYGKHDMPVRIVAVSNAAGFELSVCNAGDPIGPAALERLFQPFTRSQDLSNQQGLGLGLYIAFEIARAHGGELTASSSTEETRFTFRLPHNRKAG